MRRCTSKTKDLNLRTHLHKKAALFESAATEDSSNDMADYIADVTRAWRPAKPTAVFATYWRFAVERQRIYQQRLEGTLPPWTADPVFNRFRFTNVYRATDRVSQYLIRAVQNPCGLQLTKSDLFFRTLIFKIFNRIDTWSMIDNEIGPILWSSYDFERYDSILNGALQREERIYSPAYIMPPGAGRFKGERKHRSYLKLVEAMMQSQTVQKITECKTMRDVFETLRDWPMLGDFLSFQFTIDLNYSDLTNFSEESFVVAGPGARDGIRKCFRETGGLSNEEIIARMADQQKNEFKRLGLTFNTLYGRPMQLIDCQNVFCEVDKYSRIVHPEATGVSGRTRIKQTYRACQVRPLPPLWLPPKWGLNEQIAARQRPEDGAQGKMSERWVK